MITVGRAGAREAPSNTFVPGDLPKGAGDRGIDRGQDLTPGSRLAMGTGSGHGGEGSSGGAKIPPPEEWKYDPDYWKSYRYDSNQEKKNKEETCPIPD